MDLSCATGSSFSALIKVCVPAMGKATRSPSIYRNSLPTDRAQTLGAQFCAYPTSAGGAQIACDGSNINPVALALLNFKFPNGQYAVPSPQILLPSSGPGQMPIGESTFATPASYNEDQFTLNVDDKISEKNQFAARFFYSHAPTIEPFSPNAATVPGWGTTELDQNTMLVLSDTHVFNPQLVNIARFGYMRFDGDSAVASPILGLGPRHAIPHRLFRREDSCTRNHHRRPVYCRRCGHSLSVASDEQLHLAGHGFAHQT